MATIKICDWPLCGAALPSISDAVEVSFSLKASEREGDATLSERIGDMADTPPRLSKDLCRKHAEHLRRRLEMLFNATHEMTMIGIQVGMSEGHPGMIEEE